MKYAVIIGASGDIGQACAEELAAQGWSLYCHYHQNEERITKLTAWLRKTYPQQDFFKVHLDLRVEKQIPDFLAQLFQVDSIIFASGGTVYKLLTETTSAEMTELWQVSMQTPMLLCQQLQRKLSHQQQGQIVFIGSVYGLTGSAMEVAYSTVKGAQQAFAKAYAQEVASLGITVNVIAPGAVATQMNQSWTNKEKAELTAAIPLGRLAEPEEVAAIVAFLLTAKAKYITGTTIPVSGGWKV